MSKIIDITDRLSFDEDPKIKIKDKELTINTDATTVLKVIGLVGNDDLNMDDILSAYKLLFSESDQKNIEKMKLKFDDFVTLIKTAMSCAAGKTGDEDMGEQ